MPYLNLSLFGGFKATLDGIPVTRFRSDKVRALLAFLAVEQDQPHRREALTGLLWSEQPEKDARHNLSETLWRLRQAVSDDDSIFFHATTKTIQFNRVSEHSLDVAEFLRAIESRQAGIKHLQSAVELYRGDFLAGFTLPDAAPFEEWLLVTRERLREQMLRALETLLEHFERQRDYNGMSQFAQRTLQLEPWRESAHRALMRSLALRGEVNAALTAYERCREILASELNLEPELETRTLAEQIRQGNLDTFAVSDAPRHNLPAHLTPFIGRASEVLQVRELVAESKYRLVTLTGVGGMGKTRLAQQVAANRVEQFADGVWLVELASLQDSALVPKAVANALGAPETGSHASHETLRAFVRDKTLLLILDNCEHLLDACARLAEQLLRAAPKLQVLATSREPLGLLGEVVYRVPSFTLPAADEKISLDALDKFESVRLFVERARAVQPQFQLNENNASAVVQICRRLDGIPLALELAAARLHLLSPQEIAARLDRRFELLTGGNRAALPQHQTLRALIEWSIGLLGEDERVLFRRLSVFVGGFTLEAVEQVCFADVSTHAFEPLTLLTNLVNKSLVVMEPHDDETRYTMLETIREYAGAQLRQMGEHAPLQQQHFEYFNHRARETAARLDTREPEQWLEQLDRDLDNLRAALAWSVQAQPENALQLAGALIRFLEWRGHLNEGLMVVEQALARTDAKLYASRLAGLKTAVTLARRLGHFERAIALAQSGLELAATMEDERARSFFLNALGVIFLVQWRHETARAYFETSLALRRQSAQPGDLSQALTNMGQVSARQGDFQDAIEYDQESLWVAQQSGDAMHIGFACYAYAHLARLQGEYRAARERMEKALTHWAHIGYKWGLALAYCEWAIIAILDHCDQEADECLRYCLQLNRHIGGMTLYLIEPFIISHYVNKYENPVQAVHLLSAAETMRAQYNLQYTPEGTFAMQRAHELARSKLDTVTFAREWAIGQELIVEELLEKALG